MTKRKAKVAESYDDLYEQMQQQLEAEYGYEFSRMLRPHKEKRTRNIQSLFSQYEKIEELAKSMQESYIPSEYNVVLDNFDDEINKIGDKQKYDKVNNIIVELYDRLINETGYTKEQAMNAISKAMFDVKQNTGLMFEAYMVSDEEKLQQWINELSSEMADSLGTTKINIDANSSLDEEDGEDYDY